MKFPLIVVQKLLPEQTDAQTHKHTDRPTEIITCVDMRVVKSTLIIAT